MPDRSDKLLRLNEAAGQYELPYVSKSRVMEWVKNPEHFRLKYLEGLKEEETGAMVRGSRIHETFEHYYKASLENCAGRLARPGDTGFLSIDDPNALPENRTLWADFLVPYVTNFMAWEARRFREAGRQAEDYLPFGIEEEVWSDDILDHGPEWMGIADVLLPSSSFPEFDDGGVVVVDFKTGKVPDEKYRSDGIYMELEYYSILFSEKYNVVGAAAYYPREDELVTKPDDPQLRTDVLEAAQEMILACRDYDGDEKFEIKPGPLCGWSPDDGDRSALYGVCSQCTWNVPVNNQNTFEQMVDEGYEDYEIAEALGCGTNEVRYWKYKLNL